MSSPPPDTAWTSYLPCTTGDRQGQTACEAISPLPRERLAERDEDDGRATERPVRV